MKPIVLVGHQHHCPLHGTGTVVGEALLERWRDAGTKNRSNGIAKTEEREIEIMQRAIGSTL
ncbi:hypothetical protein [Pseudomonas aeruginosa]|uniref:hypothetical protein n=1 Tax=Pseudomonas aeruginosa TaxID=287 RepID=UPI00070FF76F|nr:hypothetical protein [Pseudomonas aeruginosa]